MKNFLLLPFSCVVCGLPLAAADGPIAFLKGNDIYVTDTNGRNPHQVGSDPRAKRTLRWDPYRTKISYLVHGTGDEMARIVEVDPKGNKTMEVPIPHDEGMRFVEDFDWLPNGKARLGGSANPRNCILEDLDPQTGEVTNGQAGKCNSFARSPDDMHIAELGLMNMTDDEHAFDTVDIDSQGFRTLRRDLYVGGGHEVFIPAGPIWSPDSQSVVFLEKRSDTSEAGVVFLTLGGIATRVAVPALVLDNPSIAWIGSKVVVGEGNKAVQIDPVTKQVSAITSDISDENARRVNARKAVEAERTTVDDLVKRMGGREGILVDMGGAK